MIPRLKLAALPTPVEFLPRLGAYLGGLRILIKRDDLTGVAFGGNKTRKLELVLAEAQSVGARTLITVGAVQSNHCRQVAALAARMGMRCKLVLYGEPPTRPSGNLFLDRLFGAEIIWTSKEARNETLNEVFGESWAQGERPYLIPLGASNALGAVAYTLAFDEMLQQTQSERIDWIVVASSSGGTQAGLVLGAHRRRFHGRVLGISIDEPERELKEVVAFLAREASDRLGKEIPVRPEEVFVNADYLGQGYGIMGEPEKEAITLFAQLEGVLLDPVYTGRAAAGLMDLARKGFFRPGETILFWHTGGTPALFADIYQNRFLNE